MPRFHSWVFPLLLLAPLVAAAAQGDWSSSTALPRVLLPKYHLAPEELAVVVNDRDPLSREIADYYRQRRGIPSKNLIHVSIDPSQARLTPEAFHKLRREVLEHTPERVQAYALTWMRPYRVGCMSITTAFAAGFEHSWCSARQCATTRQSPYFNSPSQTPWNSYRLRPTMSIAARTFRQARALIDRGIASDGSWPGGTAYLVDTPDRARNVRAALYDQVAEAFSGVLRIRRVKGEAIGNRDDVLFYFTGLKRVPGLETLKFLPGAVADHLTSTGGILDGHRQMSVLRWLEAGATASYGTVVEPCNLPQKFPNPGILMGWYLRGETLLEAYWKSVAMPGEGIFVGEPLAAPWSGYRLESSGRDFVLDTRALAPGGYRLLVSEYLAGPFVEMTGRLIHVAPGQTRMHLPKLKGAAYRLERTP